MLPQINATDYRIGFRPGSTDGRGTGPDGRDDLTTAHRSIDRHHHEYAGAPGQILAETSRRPGSSGSRRSSGSGPPSRSG
ncbi:hypothetical protein [Lapillicoccus sp.]|uniref:hypothetical protein n=1 Tax=Lapillicoccus sp. TaxID=1909287 RepID=UPI003983AB07